MSELVGRADHEIFESITDLVLHHANRSLCLGSEGSTVNSRKPVTKRPQCLLHRRSSQCRAIEHILDTFAVARDLFHGKISTDFSTIVDNSKSVWVSDP